jgi:DNA polymerase-1
MNIIKSVPPLFPDNTYIGLDSEWFGLNSKQLHRPTSGRFACMTICSDADPDTVYYIDDEQNVPNALNSIENCVWVLMNAKFDIIQLRRLATILPRKKIIDIMLMEHILFGGYYNFFSLKHMARRYLDTIVEKEVRELFKKSTSMTDEMIEYACRDVSLNLQIWNKQKQLVTKTDMNIWKQVDCPAMWAFADFQGFRIDVDAWDALADRNEQRQKDIDAKLPFNPRSPKQILPYLRDKGFKNLKNTAEESLTEAIRKYPDTEAAELAKQIQKSRKYGTRKSRYGKNFTKTYAEKENDYHVIVTNYNVTQAETGRTSSNDPAMQNIIAKDTNEFRDCFIARPGHKLVIADYDSNEPRIGAYLTQDKKLIDIFQRDEKIYTAVAREIFKKEVKNGSPEYSRAKSTLLGLDYGMSAWGLAKRENISKDEAQETINKFFGAFPGMKRWVDQQVKNTKMVKTVAGRKIWLNKYSGQCERNALNGPHQGSGGDMMKQALGVIHQTWPFDIPFAAIEQNHDELGFDVPEEYAEKVKDFVKLVMETVGSAMIKPIPVKADIVICGQWSQKNG